MSRAISQYSGVLNLLKPPGLTSHDAVSHIRRIFQERRVGHTGTLDPGAAGVLPICVGEATKIARFLEGTRKVYWAEIFLGAATDTYDAAGTITSENTTFHLAPDKVETALAAMEGPLLQIPPMYSAIKMNGQPLYQLARAGIQVEREPRRVHIYRLILREILPAGSAGGGLGYGTRLRVEIHCSKGTYIRSLADDLGKALGCGAHLAVLLRLETGPFSLDGSVTLEELQSSAAHGDLSSHVIDPGEAISFLPSLACGREEASRLGNGMPLPLEKLTWVRPLAGDPEAGEWVAVFASGHLLAMAILAEENGSWRVKPERVFREVEE